MSRAFTEALLICMKVDSLATISTSFRKSAKRILPVECAGARLPPQTDPHITPRSSSAWQHFGSPDSWRDCSRGSPTNIPAKSVISARLFFTRDDASNPIRIHKTGIMAPQRSQENCVNAILTGWVQPLRADARIVRVEHNHWIIPIYLVFVFSSMR